MQLFKHNEVKTKCNTDRQMSQTYLLHSLKWPVLQDNMGEPVTEY